MTTEVSVTREVGRLYPKTNTETNNDTELHSTSSRRSLILDQHHQEQGLQVWEPYVGGGAGLGENATVVEGPAVAKL